MDVSALKRNSASVEAGQWVSDIPGMEDVRLRVRGLNSPTVVTLRARKERLVSKNGRERNGQLKADVALRIFGEVLLEAVLFDWDGFTEGEGDAKKAIPYSKDLAKQWLSDPDFIAFNDAVTYAAQVVDRGGAEEQEEVEKNSQRPSTGKSSGAAAQKA